jgi:hypothetical protein
LAVQWAELAGFFKSIAYILGAVAFVTVAVAALVAVSGGRRLTAHIKTKLADLDMAVNGIDHDAGERPLIEKVRTIESRQSGIVTTLNRICVHLEIPTHAESPAPQEAAA